MPLVLTDKDIKKVSYLSRINQHPNPDFVDKMSEQLSKVLDLAQELLAVDTSNISPTDILRTITIEELAEDKPYFNQKKYQIIRQNIIDNFPYKKGDYLLLPTKVID